ncbi:hypothetical protein [Photobacterium lutimaris]|uniref:Restriction endonuclease n=1 Tax=Photobacterium lutimaris TaxID=388278 RepID=A0A2T3IY16_9GAMM|nr:hypothetical protein [Photobacterium lutimaris]PSU33413.1 hypothetical protein C9I99_14645 [Photobacterium lutimaris]TDR74984.1 hypothetical protein DFP78_1051 [Photobacterium lutimaris]
MEEEDLIEIIDRYVEVNGVQAAETTLLNRLAQIKKLRDVDTSRKHHLFKDEADLKMWFTENMSCDFHIRSEVCGYLNDQKVKIDFMLYPKEHLIDSGFVPEPFGVEVKYLPVNTRFTKKSSRALWQTVSYNHAKFTAKNGETYSPKFCVLFSNLSFKHEHEMLGKYERDAENDKMQWNGMLHLANHAGVGILQVRGSRKYFNGWVLRYAGGVYFSASFYDHQKRYEPSNLKLIDKTRVGNF